MFPSLFISHGAPSLAIDDGPAHRYLRSLGPVIGTPEAIVLFSAHHDRSGPEVVTSPAPETIYDFGGFAPQLRQITYPAPGAPDLAEDVIERLRGGGFEPSANPGRGFDHGAWVPLSLMFPEARIPVVQVSIDSSRSSAWHLELGETLSPLRDQRVLFVGSGNATHNLSAFFTSGFSIGRRTEPWAASYAEWLAEEVSQNDRESLLAAYDLAPYARQNHPTADHILPFYAALGAGGGDLGRRVHASTTYGVLVMDVYGFGAPDALDAIDEGAPHAVHA